MTTQYNFVASAALSCGVAISALVTFFTLQVFGIEPKWWGNAVVSEGCDGTGRCLLKTLPENEYFGPRVGEFS